MQCTGMILAAGKGERMKASLHKVLHRICGKAIIDYILEAMEETCDGRPILAISHEMEQVKAHLGDGVDYVFQDPALGWGTAMPVKVAKDLLRQRGGLVLICHGDTPLIRRESIAQLKQAVLDGADAAMLTAQMEDATGYGRIVREGDLVKRIVEEKDATQEQRAIREINASTYCFRVEALLDVIDEITPNNAKGEYYLTDAIELLGGKGYQVKAVKTSDAREGQGVNNKADLAAAAAMMRAKINTAHMMAGVEMIDPNATYIDADVAIGAGTVIYPGCVLEKGAVIGENVLLKPGCHIAASKVEDDCQIESSVVLESTVGRGTTVGPNAYLRPNSRIGDKCRIGDFVEIKNATLGNGTKVSHLTYVGDAELGEGINLGCGVVFSNYDGKNKRRSTVGDRAFIGANCNIVAPVTIGQDAYIAAGSTVTVDVESGDLCIARARETIKKHWVYRKREQGLL